MQTELAERSASPATAPLQPAADWPLVVEGVSKTFVQGKRQVFALSHVNLGIAPGEFVAVMGASGSGKSTLLHVMAGLTSVDEGRVAIAGKNIVGMRERELTIFRRKQIGLVFQAFNLIPTLTAEQNILLPIRSAGGDPQAGERLESLLTYLGLQERRKHLPDALSGGEQQRVAIARALITEPSIVLADEPTGSLDSITGQAICKLLRKLKEEQQRTIVVVTHEPSVAIWADRVVVINDGQPLAAFATADFPNPQALAAHYQDLLTSAVPSE